MNLTRRELLRGVAGLGTAAALAPLPSRRAPRRPTLRRPGSLPDPHRSAGSADARLPFDHVVVVMMENHSFDNFLGMLPWQGQPDADGFRFDASGTPVNTNPYRGRQLRVFPAPSLCGPANAGSQSWNDTHRQIDGGRMDGFAATGPGSMAYWNRADLPWTYWLAETFTLAQRWFCSAPCQTYPNRRFLLAGTAYGNISTTTASLSDPPPPNGTVFDQLHRYGVSWCDYFSNLPQTGIIPSIIKKYPANLAPMARFYADAAAGTLPAVSFVDPPFGVLADVGGVIGTLPLPAAQLIDQILSDQDADEENPGDIQLGERFVAKVLSALLRSPAWPRTLVIYTFDEHGGFYDHVPVPAAIPPDSIRPHLLPGDVPGGYDIYGPRVPAIVASPYSRPAGLSSVTYDHTSVLATIEAKWNLPALTYRDANAATVLDCLDLSRPALLHPPPAPPLPAVLAGDAACVTSAVTAFR